MTQEQFQKLKAVVDRYYLLSVDQKVLKDQKDKFLAYAGRGLKIDFEGVSCSVSLYDSTSKRLLSRILQVYDEEIAEYQRQMDQLTYE